MDGRAASLTITDKIPHLMAAGITPLVVSAVTGRRDTRFPHWQVLPWGPAGLRFDLRHLLALRWGRDWRYRLSTALISLVLLPFNLMERLLIGLQSQWSWTPAAIYRGWRVIRQYKPVVIYSTGGAYSAHWAGFWLKRLTGVRWIAEVHDPMVTPGSTKTNRNLRFWAKLEGMICAEADHAWWFTDEALAAARRRHPALGSRGFVVLPGAEPPLVTAHYRPTKKLVFGHFGSLSASRSLKPLIELLAGLRQHAPDLLEAVRVECYGGSIDAPAREAIISTGLQAQFIDHGRLEFDSVSGLSGRERIQQRMHEVDCLLLIHGTLPECAEYIPSKWYDYLWAQRPVVALTHLNPQLQQLVLEHGGYAAEIDHYDAVVRLLETVYADWRAGALRRSPLPPIGTGSAVATIVERVRGG